MPHLWTMDRSVGDWAVVALDGKAFALSADGSVSLLADSSLDRSDALVRLLCSDRGDSAAWVLIAGGRVMVNGAPAWIGIRVLRDRDEVRIVGGASWFFSTEALARTEPLRGIKQAVSCPRCKQQIGRDTEAVRCPSCRVWHHQSADLPCWTYASTCALCDQPSEFNATFRWTPAQL